MKYKSAMMTQASGSVGGMTASRNRGGNYMRARAIPTNPNTAQQIAVRGIMAQLSSLWGSTLSAGQRTAWETYASNVPLTGPLGDPITVSGLNMYVRANVPALQVGLPRVDNGPTVFDLGGFSPVSMTASTGAPPKINITFTNTDDWANEDDAAMIVYNGLAQSQTINYFTGPYRFAAKIDGNATTAPTSPAALDPAYLLIVGTRTFVKVRVIRADGRLSAIQQLIADITS